MGYSHVNSKGTTYWLHSLLNAGRGKTTLYFFSKKPTDNVDIPVGYEVGEIERSKMPVLKKIVKPVNA